MSYDHKRIETNGRRWWEENKTFATDAWDFSNRSFTRWTCSDPSGVGLHAGHPEATATDIVSRMKRAGVQRPSMGFDSFGLPRAVCDQTGNNPNGFTLKNIEHLSVS
ncbi:MAG: hypothetical protein ACLVJ6_03285 [Merdibacter sp.]